MVSVMSEQQCATGVQASPIGNLPKLFHAHSLTIIGGWRYRLSALRDYCLSQQY